MGGAVIEHLNLNETFEACRNLGISFSIKEWEVIKHFEAIAIKSFGIMQKTIESRSK